MLTTFPKSRLSFLIPPPSIPGLGVLRAKHTVKRALSVTAAAESRPPDFPSLGNLRHSRMLLRTVWRDAVLPGGVAIDATCGRGNDTLSLASCAGASGLVHALDIQKDAVEQTLAKVAASGIADVAAVNAVLKSHVSFDGLARVESGSVSAVVYNLGYLPGSGVDRSVVTTVETTLPSLRAAQEVVRVGGVITITGYYAQKGGEEEVAAVVDWAESLDAKEWSVSMVSYPNRDKAPVVLVCERVA